MLQIVSGQDQGGLIEALNKIGDALRAITDTVNKVQATGQYVNAVAGRLGEFITISFILICVAFIGYHMLKVMDQKPSADMLRFCTGVQIVVGLLHVFAK
jgi:hypothetical protein